jgi:hypothetical protein
LETEDQKELLEFAKKIVEEFIVDDAEKQVNIAEKMKEAVICAVKNIDVTVHTFDKPQTEILHLMSADRFGFSFAVKNRWILLLHTAPFGL